MRVHQKSSILVLLFLMCTDDTVLGQIATFSPKTPRIGDVISVTYNPEAQNAAIQRPARLILQTLILPEIGSSPTLIETPLTQSGRLWKGSLTLRQTDARFLLYQFVSGDLKDDNVERGWDALVVGADGKALKSGHYWRAAVFAFGGHMGFKHRQDVQVAKSEAALERKQFPAAYYAANLAWYLEMNPTPTETGRAHVRKELVTALRDFRKTEEALPMLLVWLEQTDQKTKADSLRRVFIAENPKGSVASATRMSEISKERDPLKKISLYEKYVTEFVMKESELVGTIRQLVLFYIQTGQYDNASSLLKSSPKFDPTLYSNLAAAMIEKAAQLNKAVGLLTYAIDLVRKQNDSSRVSSSTVAEWQQAHANTLSTLLNTRGMGLTELARKNEAEADFAEAYKLTGGNDPLINANLLTAYVDNGKFKEAVQAGIECIQRGKSNMAVVEKYKAAFTEVYGSLTGYDKAVQDAREAQDATLLKTGLNKLAPDFSLKDLNGNTVKLSDFRGRVIVLQFWATWSGPAKASFPFIQKALERYQYYRNVAFLALNTSENVTGAAREAAVKKFVADGKYGIRVAYDDGSAVSRKYGVEGIPTMFVIDRKGYLQFKRVGLSNGDEMVKELSTQIDVLLKH